MENLPALREQVEVIWGAGGRDSFERPQNGAPESTAPPPQIVVMDISPGNRALWQEELQ